MDMENVQDVFALSPIQEGMLFHSISDPDSGVFVTQICLRLTGPLEAEDLKAAWDFVIAKHPAMRTAIFWDGLDDPLQLVRETVEVPWEVVDWADRSDEDLDAFLAADRAAPFDLTNAPAMRLRLLQGASNTNILVWSFHHIIMDGWSSNIVMRDLFTALAGGEQEEFSVGYQDFAAASLEAWNDNAAAYWYELLHHRDRKTSLVDYAVQPQIGAGHVRLGLDEKQTAALSAFARDARVTLNTVVLGAWARVLNGFSEDPAPLFGTTLTTRPDTIDGIEEAVGVYINTLPLVVDITQDPLHDWLAKIQADQRNMQEFGLSSLSDVQRQSGLPAGTSLFDSIVVFENHGTAADVFSKALAGTGIDADILRFVDQSNFPIALLAIPGQDLSFELVFDQSRFGPDFATSLLRSLAHVLMAFVAGADSVSHAPLAPPISDIGSAVTVTAPLPDLVGTHPSDAVAARARGVDITYGKLRAHVDGLVAQMGSQQNGDYVGLFADRGVDFVAGMLAILKSGAAFVPLDPSYPDGHNIAASRDAAVATVLASDVERAKALELGDNVIDLCAPSDRGSGAAIDSDSAAYVIHTSGSQGKRKGVVVSHGNIGFSTKARDAVYGEGPKRFLLLSPVAFDSAMVGLFWTLANGGTLILPEPGQEKDVNAIAQLIKGERVTHVLCIPSLYQVLLDFAPSGSLESLDTVIVAGEACPSGLISDHFQKVPNARLFNEYGPTEASVWCIAAQLTPDDANGPVPIGYPIPGMTAHVYDAFGHPVPDGAAGELVIAGPGVARGYLNMPDATAEKFLPDVDRPGGSMYRTGDQVVRRADGSHLYLGRIDDQIKLNGFRIEPGEIAAALKTHADISEAHVILKTLPVGHEVHDLEQLLAAYDPFEADDIFSEIEAMSDADVDAALRAL